MIDGFERGAGVRSVLRGAALAHPGVSEAAAVGVPVDGGADEEVKLCVWAATVSVSI